MASVAEVCRYWSGTAGVDRIVPGGQQRLALTDALRVSLRARGFVCDVGCGTGRLARWLPADRYLGLDINEEAIRRAQVELPEHRFVHMAYGTPLPAADTYLFWTVLLHVPDSELGRVIRTIPGLPGRQVIVVETMDPVYRDGRFNYQRDRLEYVAQFNMEGWIQTGYERVSQPAKPWFKDWLTLEWTGGAQ